ncbi:hypothetical protein Tco_1387481 [Tanacetum coccineum]
MALHIGLDSNDKAADSKDVEVLEVQPLGRGRSKKKPSAARSESSSAGEPGVVQALLIKWKNIATPLFSQKKEASAEYLRIKERQLIATRIT